MDLPADLLDADPPWERYADNAWRRTFSIADTPCVVTQTLVISLDQRDVHTQIVPPGQPAEVFRDGRGEVSDGR
jgi:hypothetical protein